MTDGTLEVWLGSPRPLGASWDGRGINFAVFSEGAERLEVCLFDAADASREVRRFTLPGKTRGVHHAYVPGLPLGTLYGLRAYGPWAPGRGLRFNPQKLLLDPYARVLTGRPNLSHPAFAGAAFEPGAEEGPDARDTAVAMPRCMVVDGSFDWEGDSSAADSLDAHHPLRSPRARLHQAPPRHPP